MFHTGMLHANVCAKNGSIAEISRETRESAEIIDATGLHFAHGFIDIHAHIAGNDSAGEHVCRQGTMAVVNGNCGIGYGDIPSLMNERLREGRIVNQIEFAGATIIRKSRRNRSPRVDSSAAGPRRGGDTRKSFL